MNTAHKIINLLNQKAHTVNEVAKALSISRNAAHLQISKLEATGALEKLVPRYPSGAGKPAHEYRTVAGKEDLFSSAYKPLIDVLMQTMTDELDPEVRASLFKQTGRMLAVNAGLVPGGNAQKDLQKALHAVNELGAMAELSCEHKKKHIRCYSCPVATLVHTDPLTCDLVAAFFSQATGKKVLVQCNREQAVVCGFQIE